MFESLFKYPLDVYLQSELAYTSSWPAGLVPALGTLGLAAITGLLVRRRKRARPHQLASLWALQVALLALVLWVLLLPALTTEQLRPGENAVALMLDTSASMAYGPDRPRIADARDALEAAIPAEAGLDLSIRRYEFSTDATPVDSFRASQAAGERTAIATAASAVLREARVGSLAAVIIASDGGDTEGGITGPELAEIAAWGVPVHVIAVGREVMPEDLELADVSIPARALPGGAVTARVSIRHDAGGDTRIRVYDGDTLVASEPLSLRDDTTMTTARIEIRLPDAGPHPLDVVLDGATGEQETRNNRRTRLVDVSDEDYRVLYFEGEPRWEYKFLRRALQPDDDLRLESLLRVSTNKFYRQGLGTPEQLESGFPSTAEELFAYDALVIGSVEAASLSVAQQQLIREFVSERGGSLLMLGGPNGLGSGGWGGSAVADVLPTRLPGAGVESFFRIKAPVSITPQGNDTQMLALSDTPNDNRRSWSELPAVADYQLAGTLKPAATELLRITTDRGDLPLLVAQPFGRGLSYILATGGTWRWQMSLPVEDQRHEIFWRQLLRTLVASAPKNVSLTTGTAPGAEGIALRAEFRDERFEPMQDIGVSAVVSGDDGRSFGVPLQPSPDERGVYTATLDPGQSGVYFVEAVAEQNGTPLQTVRASLHYEAGQAEHFGIRRNGALLRRLAEASGGRYLELGDLGAIPDLLRYSSAGITEIELRPVWDLPAVFLLLLLLKAAEWLLRRRWRMI